MSELTILNGLLIKLYSNKNFNTFKYGLMKAQEELDISGIYGIIYDDFDIKEELKNKWIKEYQGIKIFTVARRRKTIRMDSKLLFANKMKESIYTPVTYLKYQDIPITTDKNKLFFVKKDGSTGSKHVYISKYQDLSNIISKVDCSNQYILQESMSDPDLYNEKRYKIRVHVILHNNEVYLHKKTFATVSSEKFSVGGIKDTIVGIKNEDLQKMNVICQANSERFILYNEINNYELIEQNIILALKDFKNYYINEINNINDSEFSILGFDFVVDSKKNVNIIEINHRSNYHHPEEISNDTDKVCIKDLFKLLIAGKIENTAFYKI
jgi:hypothetical protein